MNTMERDGRWCWLAAVVVGLAFAGVASAATVYWTNTDATATWTVPDSTHFSTAPIGSPGSPATYNNGDTVQFGNLGSLPASSSTNLIAAGGVAPSQINMYTPRYVNRITFNIGEDNALGTASFDTDYQVYTTFNNTKGSEVTLANNFIYGNSYLLIFTGGDFRLTGTVSGGGNGGVIFRPAAGVTLTLENGVAGTAEFGIQPSVAGGTVRILGTSGAGLNACNADVTIEIGADNALGPSGKQMVTGNGTKFAAYGGARTLDNSVVSRGFTVQGSNDLTINGAIQNFEGYWVYKLGSSTLTLNGSNAAWGNNIAHREGVIRAGHANAIGTSGVRFNGGVLELGAADFTWSLSVNPWANTSEVGWITDGAYGGSGGFSAYGANRFVNLGGTNGVVTWGSGGFVPTGQVLIFGSASANAQLDFQNPINLNGAVRTVQVNDNTNSTADRAVLSGVLSGTGSSGVTKTGDGTLFFNATNTYTGATTVSAGSVGGHGRLAGSLVFNTGSGFVADLAAPGAPLAAAGSVDLSNADTLTVLGTPAVKARTVILTADGGVTGTFDTVNGLPDRWAADYSVPGEVALKPPPSGTLITIH